jgi:hypothetical protein
MNGIENILRWFAEISAALRTQIAYFSRPRLPASDIVEETPSDGAAGETGANASAADAAIVAPNVQDTFIAADAKIGQEALISRVAAPPTDDREIQRRRALIRTLFNNFWSEREDKPATFVDQGGCRRIARPPGRPPIAPSYRHFVAPRRRATSP